MFSFWTFTGPFLHAWNRNFGKTFPPPVLLFWWVLTDFQKESFVMTASHTTGIQNIHLLLTLVYRALNVSITFKTKWPPNWIYYISNAHISTKMYTFKLMNACLWTTMDGKASWSINGDQRHQQGTKLENVESQNVLDKGFALVWVSCDSSFHPKNYTSELCLLFSTTLSVNKKRWNDTFPHSWLVSHLQRPHTGVSISLLLWSVCTKFYEEWEQFMTLQHASFVADKILHVYWDSSYLCLH